MILILRASFVAAAATLVCLALAACSEGPAAPSATTPQEVGVLSLEPAKLPIIRELPGRIAPTRIAEVRARVSGIVISRTSSKAARSRPATCSTISIPRPTKSNSRPPRRRSRRPSAVFEQEDPDQPSAWRPWSPTRAVSQSQYENAHRNLLSGRADVAARKADVARAKLNLDYTTVIARRSAAASAARWSPKARWSARAKRRIWRRSSISTRSMPTSRNRSASSTSFAARFERAISKRAGRKPPRCGWCSTTAKSIRTRASCCSPTPPSIRAPARSRCAASSRIRSSELLPGMYVRVQIVQGIDPDALAVPQQAVRRNDAGASEVFVAARRQPRGGAAVRLGRAVGDHWLVDRRPQARRPRRGRRLPEIRRRRSGRSRSPGAACARPTPHAQADRAPRVKRHQRSNADGFDAELLHRPAHLRVGGGAADLSWRRCSRFRYCRSRNIRSLRRLRSRSAPAIRAPRRRTSTTASPG